MSHRIQIPVFFLGLWIAGCTSVSPTRPNNVPPPDAPVFSQASPPVKKPIVGQERQRTPQATRQVPLASPPNFDPETNIFFRAQSTAPTQESSQVLRRLSERLKANPRMSVLLVGHTDDLGSSEYCIAHSSKLTSAVADALENLDVRPSQIRELPQGSVNSSYPGCTSDDCLRMLRRVELQVSGS